MSYEQLMQAIEKSDFENVQKFATQATIKQTSNPFVFGSNALLVSIHYCGHNNPEIIRHLISLGADTNSRKRESGRSVLHEAIEHKLPIEIIKLLIEKGAQVNYASKSGITPLHSACKVNYKEAALYLIESGANVNAAKICKPDPLGWTSLTTKETPLHIAAKYGSLSCLEVLLQSEQLRDINAKIMPGATRHDGHKSGGNTALHLAEKGGHKECAEYLRSHGAKEEHNHTYHTPKGFARGYVGHI